MTTKRGRGSDYVVPSSPWGPGIRKKIGYLRTDSLSATLTRQSEQHGDPGTAIVLHDFRILGKSTLQTSYLITFGSNSTGGMADMEWEQHTRMAKIALLQITIRHPNFSDQAHQPSGYWALQYLR